MIPCRPPNLFGNSSSPLGIFHDTAPSVGAGDGASVGAGLGARVGAGVGAAPLAGEIDV